ncbi:MAG: TonB family protein [Cyclobacteriaceae bacterium]
MEVFLDSIEESTIMFGGNEEYPRPIGGMINLYEKLEEELKVPPRLSEKGKVFIQFSLDTLGNITETTIIHGLSEAADREALRALSVIDVQFIPAKIDGRPVEVKMVLPVTFDPENQNKE